MGPTSSYQLGSRAKFRDSGSLFACLAPVESQVPTKYSFIGSGYVASSRLLVVSASACLASRAMLLSSSALETIEGRSTAQ